jgi:hypothetical protein
MAAIMREAGRAVGIIVGCDESIHSGIIVEVIAEAVGGEGRSVVRMDFSGIHRLDAHRVRVVDVAMDVEEFLLDIECRCE